MEVKQFRATQTEYFTAGVGAPFLPNKCSFCAIYTLLFKRLEECICSDTLAEPSNFRKLVGKEILLPEFTSYFCQHENAGWPFFVPKTIFSSLRKHHRKQYSPKRSVE